MSITLGITSWQEGNSGWVATLNADLNRLASAVDSVSSGNISSGSILPLALNSDNSVTLGGIIAVDSTTGHFYVKPSGVNFSDLPGQSGFTGGEIVRAKSDLSGLEPIPDNSIDFEKIDYAGSAGSIKIIMHNGTKPELYTQIPTGNLPQIPVENLPIYTGGGTPLTGYVIKAYVSGGQITYLYPDITANSDETNRIKWTSALTDSPLYGDEFVTQKLPNYANIGKVLETDGNLVNPTSANFVGKAQNSSGASFTYLNDWQISGDFNGKIRRTSSAGLQYVNEYLLASFKESGPVTVFDNTTSVSIGIRNDVSFLIDKTFNAAVLVGVKAQTYLKGVTGSTTIMLLRRRLSETLGDSTTRFDVTRPGTPNANTTRFTYDGTGTNPNISDADASLRAGDYMMIYGSNFSAGNKGVYKLTAVGSNYFEVTNSAGVAEADKTIGTGYMIPIKMMLSTSLSISDAFDSESCVIYAETTRKTLQTGDLIIPEIFGVHSTPPVGLCLAYRFGGINEAD